MTAAERIRELRAALAAATQGEWACWDGYGPSPDGLMHAARIGPRIGGLLAPHGRDILGTAADMEAACRAVNALPALLAIAEAALTLDDLAHIDHSSTCIRNDGAGVEGPCICGVDAFAAALDAFAKGQLGALEVETRKDGDDDEG